MKTKLLIISMALTLPSLAAWAQAPRGHNPPPGPGPHDEHGPEVHDDPHRNPMFHALLKALDTDGDGVISMTEMNHAAESLLALDKNGDGELSNSELCQHGPRKDGQKDDNGDKGDKPDNGDKPDKPKRPDDEKGDKSADKDNQKDGDDDKKQRRGDGPKDHKDDGPKEDEQRSALVNAIDTNHDGRISADEIAAARANLKKLDLNHDGKLSPWEYGRPHQK